MHSPKLHTIRGVETIINFNFMTEEPKSTIGDVDKKEELTVAELFELALWRLNNQIEELRAEIKALVDGSGSKNLKSQKLVSSLKIKLAKLLVERFELKKNLDEEQLNKQRKYENDEVKSSLDGTKHYLIDESVEVLRKNLEVNSKFGEYSEQLSRAQEIMGDDYLGPEAVEKAFGIQVKAEDIPPIPFSEADLERAKALGQMLILRVDKTADGQALTMKRLNELVQPRLDEKKLGKVLYGQGWYTDEDFYTVEAVPGGWALVTKEVLPNSTKKNYLQQTEVIVDYLKKKVFPKNMPPHFQQAIADFESQKTKLAKLINNDWAKAAKTLEVLAITRLTRPTPAAVLYDLLIAVQNKPGRLLENKYVYTSRRSSNGDLVCVGHFSVGGAYVGLRNPDDAVDNLGVSFSRSH